MPRSSWTDKQIDESDTTSALQGGQGPGKIGPYHDQIQTQVQRSPRLGSTHSNQDGEARSRTRRRTPLIMQLSLASSKHNSMSRGWKRANHNPMPYRGDRTHRGWKDHRPSAHRGVHLHGAWPPWRIKVWPEPTVTGTWPHVRRDCCR